MTDSDQLVPRKEHTRQMLRELGHTDMGPTPAERATALIEGADDGAPPIERVRELAECRAGDPAWCRESHDDDALDFYSAAIDLGYSPAKAESFDEKLMLRRMKSLGVV